MSDPPWNAPRSKAPRKRLAIIGAGSSGLITLKHASSLLADWEIICFEKSGSVQGCWGNPFPGFISTSTKYTTQFACYALFDVDDPDADDPPVAEDPHAAFFRDGEYGQYLESFASHFQLRQYVRLHCDVTNLRCANSSHWEVTWQPSRVDADRHGKEAIEISTRIATPATTESFDAVIVCTGLAEVPKQIVTDIPTLSPSDFRSPESLAAIHGERIVVLGGGESAVDYAYRLSRPEHHNTVYLSLRSGIRVSPRIHPIRGVPSDFLRTRWMLSIHADLRNRIGEQFVRTRIRYESMFQKRFPAKSVSKTCGREQQHHSRSDHDRVKADWAMKLTRSAKDGLFDMFHNKSDDFLAAVAREELQIIGPPINAQHTHYHTFDSADVIDVHPTRLVPAIGYQSRLASLTKDTIHTADFYLGCLHAKHPHLFLIGFARPIIGNIPSISEVQARWVCGLLAGKHSPPDDIADLHRQERQQLSRRYPVLNIEHVYPVEMFPYCDHLARLMGEFPTVRRLGGWRRWWRQQFTPATTLHYLADQIHPQQGYEKTPVFLPWLFIILLVLLWPIDQIYRWRGLLKRPPVRKL